MKMTGFDVKRFDIYRKIPKDLTQPTTTGAVISICCVTFMTLMLCTELCFFIAPDVRSELLVDVGGSDKIPVRINISLPKLKCEFIGLDIQDDQGRHEVGFIENIAKTPIGRDAEGCLFEGRFQINKVPGNFHMSTHSVDVQPDNYDFEHEIHEISFGSKIRKMTSKGIGSFNSLGGTGKSANQLESHEYVMKIVPTTYEDLQGVKLVAYQYTYAYRSYISFGHGGRVVPAIWFRYDLNPISVRYHESRPPLYHFLTTVCAIVGGTFTVAGIIDSCVFTAHEMIKKFELGKLS